MNVLTAKPGDQFAVVLTLVRLAEEGEEWMGEKIVSNIRQHLWWAKVGGSNVEILVCTEGINELLPAHGSP